MTEHDEVTPQGPHPSEAMTEVGAPGSSEPRDSTWPGASMKLAERYQLEEAVASGGAAIVWRAFDDVLSRSVAVKLLHPHLATDEVTVERFRLESINAARLSHPNVVQIYDTGHERDVVYLVMEYVDGPSLRDLLKDSGPLEPEVVAALGEQVASALGEAHEQGVVHRDVKPANILVTSDGVAKVTDFGIAKALSGTQTTLTSPGTVVGTAAYVAPEQLEGKDVDARADVYALGIVLYEALTGRAAFKGDTPTATAAARLTQDLLPPRQVRADVPKELEEVIVRATRRSADARFRNGNEMAAALAQLVSAKPSDVTATLITGDLDVHSDRLTADNYSGGSATRMTVSRSQYGRRLALAFLGGLVLAAVAFFALQALTDEEGVAETTEASGEGLAGASASIFDPFGEGGENPGQVDNTLDGDTSTVWSTQTYRDSSRFGDQKPGVGLLYEFEAEKTVGAVGVDLTAPGATLAVYAGGRSAGTLPEWGEPRGMVRDAGEQVQIAVGDQSAQYWLVWLSQLPSNEDGTFRAEIREVRFLAP